MISGGLLEKMKRLPLPVWCVWCACRGGGGETTGCIKHMWEETSKGCLGESSVASLSPKPSALSQPRVPSPRNTTMES
jgi:hypothetical protein